PENRAAIDLRVDIWNGNLTGDHTLLRPPMIGGPNAYMGPGAPFGNGSDEAMWQSPGMFPPGQRDAPFGDPPFPAFGTSNAPSVRTGPSSPPGNGGPVPVTPPQRIENVPQGRPLPQDARNIRPTVTTPLAGSQTPRPASDATQSSRLSVASRALDANRLPDW